MLRPFSSKKRQSSAKYFLQGVASPPATELKSSCARRTSSSCVIAGEAGRDEHPIRMEHAASVRRTLRMEPPVCGEHVTPARRRTRAQTDGVMAGSMEFCSNPSRTIFDDAFV